MKTSSVESWAEHRVRVENNSCRLDTLLLTRLNSSSMLVLVDLSLFGSQHRIVEDV